MRKFTATQTILLFIVGFSCISIPGCRKELPVPTKPVNDLYSLVHHMPDPPAMFRPVTFWDWNDRITREEIAFQFGQFKEGGMGGVFVHPRPGLVTEYLSDEWFELFNYTVEIAGELGLTVWIYDENSYPSGFAGGHVQAEMPGSYANGTGLTIEIREKFTPDPEKELFMVLQQKDGQWIRIEEPYSPEYQTAGTYCIVYKTYGRKSYWFGNYPYIDLIYPGVTEKFIELTYRNGYQKYAEDEFGKTVVGAFTDEPNLGAALDRESDIRWTPDLFDRFEQRWGYLLPENLPSLVSETGDWKKVRHDYHLLLSELFIERWAKPHFEYMEEKELIWTGHYWEHGWPSPGEGIDEMATYFWHQMPGIDMLGRTYDPEGIGGQFGNTRAVRELASAANQSGARRTLSETWGGAGYQVTFAELKRLLDWEVVLGVNFINPHLSYYSMQGVRKYDYPPTFSYHEPWWDCFSLLSGYAGRICLGTSAGFQNNSVLVLQPNIPACMYYTRKTKYDEIRDLEVATKKLLLYLEEAHVEYDLGSETVMRERGSVTDDLLHIGKGSYNMVIIPPFFENLEGSTVRLLKEFLAGGGRVVSLTRSIPRVDGSLSDEADDLAGRYADRWNRIDSISAPGIIAQLLPADFRITPLVPGKGQLFHQRRQLEDGMLMFFVNASLEESVSARVETNRGNLYRFDLNNGTCFRLETDKGQDLTFNLELPPGGSAMYVVSGKKIRKLPVWESMSGEGTDIPPAGETTLHLSSPNVLAIDYCNLKTWKSSLEDTYYMNAMYRLFEDSELPTGNPWQHKIQYRKTYLEMDTFNVSTPFTVEYRFYIDESLPQEKREAMQAVIERPSVWSVKVNGQSVTPEKGQWWLEKHFPVYGIGPHVRTGQNSILLEAPGMSVFAEIMPVFILGDFAVESAGRGFVITTSQPYSKGSWRQQGAPFYSDGVVYTRSFIVEKPQGQYYITLDDWSGTVAQVKVNGQDAGVIAWQPFELEVSGLVTEGINTVEVGIFGSLKNVLGYHHQEIRGWIDSPWSWNSAPAKQPPGDQYHFLDYGLYGKIRMVNR